MSECKLRRDILRIYLENDRHSIYCVLTRFLHGGIFRDTFRDFFYNIE